MIGFLWWVLFWAAVFAGWIYVPALLSLARAWLARGRS